MAPKKPLEIFPNDQNFIELKLSSNIKRYFVNLESQLNQYETLYEGLIKL